MRIGGVYVGLGEGDVSPEVGKVKALLKKKFTPARNTLDDGDTFTPALTAEVTRVQHVYTSEGKPGRAKYVPGVINVEFKYDVGLLKRPPVVRPVIFTVEGHLSNMWAGPCASTASQLEQQGVCKWQPVDYDCAALPFNNFSGVSALVWLMSASNLPDGTPFPAGTPWGIEGFSQGGMVVSEFMEQHVLPESGVLHWRLKDFKRGLGLGNPRRERGKLAPWAVSRLSANSGGIMDHLFTTTGTAIEGRWQENAHAGDLFADNGTDEASQDKTLIAKVITEGTFSSVAGALLKVLALFMNLPAEALPAIKAAFSAIFFLAANPNPHYSTVSEPGDVEWMRGVAT
jgi:hypothetical protein